jgi:hypothetical protein
MDDGGAHEIYSAVIVAALNQEYARKQSLEQRGLAVITTAGTLVSLIFGFAVFAGAKALDLPTGTKFLLGFGLGFFLLSAIFGLRINRPLRNYYAPVAVRSLRHAVEPDNWIGSAVEASRKVSEYRVSELDAWRNGNGIKANALHRAVMAETAGVALITGGIMVLIFNH